MPNIIIANILKIECRLVLSSAAKFTFVETESILITSVQIEIICIDRSLPSS